MDKLQKGFVHKVDKPQIPVCNIMGVNIAAVNMDWLLDFTKKNIKDLSGDYMCVSNAHTTVISYKDEEYRAIQNGGIMAIPDGGPLTTLGKRYGHKCMERTTGPDYMEGIFKVSSDNEYRHYFYGATKDTLKKMYQQLKTNYPGISIVGMFSPPFRTMTDEEDMAIVKEINETKPDFIWIGLGAPKQEKWMATHQGKVEGFMIGVGAGFDYFAGNLSRAPRWMQKANLEWAFRLIQDPKRLFPRYIYTNINFIWHAFIKGE